MQSLSIDRAWNETRTRVFANSALLWPIAFALLALPTVIVQALVIQPRAARFEASGGTDFAAFSGPWILWLLPVFAATIVGTIAILVLTNRSGVSVGEALQAGIRRAPVLFLASLLLGIVVGIGGGILATIFVAILGQAGIGLTVLVIIPIAIFIAVRFILVSPAAASETGGPVSVLRRSWALTRGHFWRLFGMILLLAVVSFVVALFVTVLFGIIVGLATGGEPGPIARILTLLVGGLVNAVISVLFTVMIGRIYAQLAGSPDDVETVFA